MDFEYVVIDYIDRQNLATHLPNPATYHYCFHTLSSAIRAAVRLNEDGSDYYVLGPGEYRMSEYGPCHLCGSETLDQHGTILLGNCECGAHTIEV